MDRARLMAIMERVGVDSRTVDEALSDSEDTMPSSSLGSLRGKRGKRRQGSAAPRGQRVRTYIEEKGFKATKGSRASDDALREAIARIDAELEATKRRGKSTMDASSSSALFDDDDDSLSTLSDAPPAHARTGATTKYQKLLDQFVACQREKEAAIVKAQKEKVAAAAAMDALRAQHKADAQELRDGQEHEKIAGGLRSQLASAKSAFDGALTISPALHDALRRSCRPSSRSKSTCSCAFTKKRRRTGKQKARFESAWRSARAPSLQRARVRELEATAGSSDRVLQRKTAGLERELAASLEEANRSRGPGSRPAAGRNVPRGCAAVRRAAGATSKERAGPSCGAEALRFSRCCCADATKSVAARDGDAQAVLQQTELLRVDKAYLSKELGVAQGRVRDLTTKLERQEEKVRAAERARDNAIAEQLSRSEKGRAGYERRLQRELEAFKLQQQKHLSDIQSAHRDSMAREIASMREQRDLARADVDRLEASNSELKARVDELQRDVVRRQAEASERQTELRGALQMKVFELERVAATCDDQMRAASNLEIETEKLRTKLEALTREYQQLDLSKEKTVADLRAKLETERSRVKTYELLELELDAAIVAQPQDAPAGEDPSARGGIGGSAPHGAHARAKKGAAERRPRAADCAARARDRRVEGGNDAPAEGKRRS